MLGRDGVLLGAGIYLYTRTPANSRTGIVHGQQPNPNETEPGSILLRYCFDQRLHIARRKRPAPVTPRRIDMSVRDMVIDAETLVPAIVIDLHGTVHIDVACVDELLGKVLGIRL